MLHINVFYCNDLSVHNIYPYTLNIVLQLGEIGSPSSGNIGYQFMDRNQWPVTRDQENSLNVIDCLINGIVRVCPPVFGSSFPALVDKNHDKKFLHVDTAPEKRKK